MDPDSLQVEKEKLEKLERRITTEITKLQTNTKYSEIPRGNELKFKYKPSADAEKTFDIEITLNSSVFPSLFKK